VAVTGGGGACGSEDRVRGTGAALVACRHRHITPTDPIGERQNVCRGTALSSPQKLVPPPGNDRANDEEPLLSTPAALRQLTTRKKIREWITKKELKTGKCSFIGTCFNRIDFLLKTGRKKNPNAVIFSSFLVMSSYVAR
jgi:hypothetical protein